VISAEPRASPLRTSVASTSPFLEINTLSCKYCALSGSDIVLWYNANARKRRAGLHFGLGIDGLVFSRLTWRLAHLHSDQPRYQDRKIELAGDSFGDGRVARLKS
jgi:hypothetical protein